MTCGSSFCCFLGGFVSCVIHTFLHTNRFLPFVLFNFNDADVNLGPNGEKCAVLLQWRRDRKVQSTQMLCLHVYVLGVFVFSHRFVAVAATFPAAGLSLAAPRQVRTPKPSIMTAKNHVRYSAGISKPYCPPI